MTAMTEPIKLAEGRPFAVHDLAAMPDEQGHYQLAATVSGDEVFTARRPVPVQV